MIETQQVPNNIPISWLNRLTKFTHDTLMLASELNSDTETQYMSKYFTYMQFLQSISSELSISQILTDLSGLQENACMLSNYMDNTIAINSFHDPYIISSLRQGVSSDRKSFGILSCDGYRLSTGISAVFQNLVWNNVPVSGVIPQLSSNTVAVDDPNKHFISAITDENGHIKQYEYGQISDIASTVYYKDYTEQLDADDKFDNANLYIMKLTYDQLMVLSSRGKIRQDCIYMTINDPEE